MNILEQGLGLVFSSLYYTISGFLFHTPKFCLTLLLKVGTHNADSVKPLVAQANEKLEKNHSTRRSYLLGIASSGLPLKRPQCICISNGDTKDIDSSTAYSI